MEWLFFVGVMRKKFLVDNFVENFVFEDVHAGRGCGFLGFVGLLFFGLVEKFVFDNSHRRAVLWVGVSLGCRVSALGVSQGWGSEFRHFVAGKVCAHRAAV